MKSSASFGLIKALLFLKALILVGFLLVETNVIKLGEAQLFAQKDSATIRTEDPNSQDEDEYFERDIEDIEELLKISTEDNEEAKASVSRYLDVIERKKQEAESRLNLLKAREDTIKKLEGVVDKKLKELEEERRYIVQTIQKEKEIKEERLDRLTNLYEKMEPKRAAPVFEELDRDLAVALFKNLKKKQVTAILEKMDPDKAVTLTEYYGRVKSGAEYDLLKEMNKSLVEAFEGCK